MTVNENKVDDKVKEVIEEAVSDETTSGEVGQADEAVATLSLKKERPIWHVIVSLALSITLTIIVVYGGYKLIIYFMPFVIGWIISFIANPLVLWLEKRVKMVKKWSSAIIIILVLAIVFTLGYLLISRLISEIVTFTSYFPAIYRHLENAITQTGESLTGVLEHLPMPIQEGLHSLVDSFRASMGNLIRSVSQPTVEFAGSIAMRIPSVLIASIVMLLSSYFFIAHREEVIVWSKGIAPKSLQTRTTLVVENLKTAMGGYFKAQFKIMGVICIGLFIGFLILGIRNAALIAILIAALDFLPVFGTGTALFPWAIISVLNGDYKRAVGLMIIYVCAQIIRQVIQPKLVGDSIGMNPIASLVLLYLGYKMGSLLGLIVAVPIGMIVYNLYKAGAFDYILDDIKILVEGALSLREK